MSLASRIANLFRQNRLHRELDAELQSHLEEAVERGRDPAEARRAFGSALHVREESRDIKMAAWLDSLRADSIFAGRQLWKHKITSAAAILSLALAIGACTSAFRLIDALLLRPLPIAAPERLYAAARRGLDDSGQLVTGDIWTYPGFEQMRAAVAGLADVLAVSFAEPLDVTYGPAQEVEKATVQYVSGALFDNFGLRPAAGRLLSANDDVKAGAHPYAVLSYDYWSRRFGRDASVVGREVHLDNGVFEIVGIGPRNFTGTETGIVTDIFLPVIMHPGALRNDWAWHRTLVHLRPGVVPEPVRARMHAASRAFEEERAKGFKGMTRETLQRFLDLQFVLLRAAAGASAAQQDYRLGLLAMAILVALVLLIACANVANLMAAQAAARAREMAMRVSIGAGRARLVQLVLVESAWLALLAAIAGAWFAEWSAPFVVARLNPPDHPVRLMLTADWRVLGFGLALTVLVTLLFGLAPAIRAAKVDPALALKGGADPHARRRLMHGLIAMQVAFCFLVLFVAGLFSATFDRLSHRPTGFNPERLLAVETIAQRAAPGTLWEQAAEHLRQLPGVESVALAGWPLLKGESWNGFVSVNGAPPSSNLAQFFAISPGWRETMQLPLIDGRDFRPTDTNPGSAIVSEAFVREFLPAMNPIGQTIAKGDDRYQVIGVAKDAPYGSMHGPMQPVAYVPFRRAAPVRTATFMVRTRSANPLALTGSVRAEVPRARPEFRVTNITSQADLVRAQTLRERLLAMLALFFAAVALLLGSIGLYGVLDYSVLQRRREIGIRMAIGAQVGHIARGVTGEAMLMVGLGAAVGVGLGMLSVRYIASLLWGVQATDPAMLAIPAAVILIATLAAALPAVLRAVRIDPARTLRAE